MWSRARSSEESAPPDWPPGHIFLQFLQTAASGSTHGQVPSAPSIAHIRLRDSAEIAMVPSRFSTASPFPMPFVSPASDRVRSTARKSEGSNHCRLMQPRSAPPSFVLGPPRKVRSLDSAGNGPLARVCPIGTALIRTRRLRPEVRPGRMEPRQLSLRGLMKAGFACEERDGFGERR
jgi:hypothetical protein